MAMEFGEAMFNGGGFLPGPAAATTPGAEKGRDGPAMQSLRSLTIKQLHDAIAASPSPDADLEIDGQPLSNLTLVGKIVDVSEHASSMLLTVDDGTGRAPVKFWGDAEDGDAAAARRAAWTPGAYVRVHGHVRVFDGARSIVAFNVRPVTDSNEITHHQLQCILQHAHLVAGAPGAGSGAATAATAAAGGIPAQPAFGAAPVAAPAAPGAGGNPNDVGTDGLTNAQRDVKSAVAALGGGANGASVDEVAAALPAVPPAAVKDAVAFLLEEGHLYSTVDENHVKVA